ncbi:MAG: GNAT family N-acetyltransferase [Erysipelotrichaceae bacterium]|nr:GNAT family N-acetyltransferase [Erysipelotrichaceae bacterium]
MELFVRRFDELDIHDLYEIMKLRCDVFIVEQECHYEDIDGRDINAIHVYLKDNNEIVGYLRILDKGVVFKEVSIGRVIAKRRRVGIGSELLKAGLKAAKKYYNADKIKIEAQVNAKSFYERVGFKVCGAEFLEDGIPHVPMVVEL